MIMNINNIEIALAYTIIEIKAINSAPNNKKQIPVNIKLNIRHNIDVIVFFENTIKKLNVIRISIIENNINFILLIL